MSGTTGDTAPPGGSDAASDLAASGGGSGQVPAELARLRGSIDNLDAILIHLMAERFRITQRVGELKAELGMPASDPAREAEQVARMRALAIESRLDPEFAQKLISFIVSEVVRNHLEIRGEGQGDLQHPD